MLCYSNGTDKKFKDFQGPAKALSLSRVHKCDRQTTDRQTRDEEMCSYRRNCLRCKKRFCLTRYIQNVMTMLSRKTKLAMCLPPFLSQAVHSAQPHQHSSSTVVQTTGVLFTKGRMQKISRTKFVRKFYVWCRLFTKLVVHTPCVNWEDILRKIYTSHKCCSLRTFLRNQYDTAVFANRAYRKYEFVHMPKFTPTVCIRYAKFCE